MKINEINQETLGMEIDNALPSTLKKYNDWGNVIGNKARTNSCRITSPYGAFNSPLEADLYEVWLYAKGEIDDPYINIVCQSITEGFFPGLRTPIPWDEWTQTAIGQVVYDAMVRWENSRGM